MGQSDWLPIFIKFYCNKAKFIALPIVHGCFHALDWQSWITDTSPTKPKCLLSPFTEKLGLNEWQLSAFINWDVGQDSGCPLFAAKPSLPLCFIIEPSWPWGVTSLMLTQLLKRISKRSNCPKSRWLLLMVQDFNASIWFSNWEDGRPMHKDR